MSQLSYERLSSLLFYDPATGIFTWRIKTKRKDYGEVAGSPLLAGYIRIVINGEKFMAHRLAWLYMTKVWPTKEIDHINRDRKDNRWVNLREASSSENSCNTAIRSDNTSGVKGVYWHKRKMKWVVQITANKSKQQLGHFDDFELAELVATEAREKLHGKFASLT